MFTHSKLLRTVTIGILALALPVFGMLLFSGERAHAAAGDSFDPATNPTLQKQDARFAAGWNNEREPATDAGGRGLCKVYVVGGAAASGCAKGSVFTLYLPSGPESGGITAVDSTGGVAATAPELANAAGAPPPQPKKCPEDPGQCFLDAITRGMSTIVGGLAWVVLSIAAFMLWIVGGLFNWVVIKTVFEFGTYFGTSNGMLLAWGILRDIGNIVLLFGFIFMGLATILNTHALDEYSARKALPRLIIFAVLMNFSLFAAQIVIDVSNSFASVFTAQAGLSGCTGGSEIDPKTGLPGTEACANNGIAGQVLQMAGISGSWVVTDIGSFMQAPQKHAPVFIGLAIFMTITAVVLLAAAIMLVFRAVMLCLLMVLSPIGFAGMAIPPLQEFAKKWWKQLLSNAFFAPVYLLLVLISLKIVEGLVGTNGGATFSQALINGGTSAPQIFVIFTVVIAFMVASLVVAKSMGAAGADFATRSAGGFVLGSQGFLGRRSFGWAFNKGATAVQNSNWAQKNPNRARFAYNVLSKGAAASYSTRSVASTLGKGAHLDFGKPNKTAAHGFHGIEEKATKDREEFEKKVKPTTEQKGVAKEIEEELKDLKKDRKRYVQAELDAIQEQRLVVEKARLGNDKEQLAAARAELEQRIRAYAAKNGEIKLDKNTYADAQGGQYKERQEALEKRLKTWSARADAEKRENYIAAMEHAFEIFGPFSPEAHANHEAAANIRKNAGKSKMDKAFDELKKGVKEESDEGGGETPAPPAGGPAPGPAH